MARSEDVKTPLARLAFTDSLFKPQERKGGKKQWGCSLLWPKGTDLSVLEKAALDAAVEEWGPNAAQMIKDEIIKSPFLDGDSKQGKNKETGVPHDGFPGHRFIRVISGEDYRPKLINRQVLPITDKADCASGMLAYAVVNAFTWQNDENGKGISFGVSMIQVAKDDGTRLGGTGGGGNPEQFFEKIADEGDAPDSTKSGAGAAGLFS